MYMNTCIQNNGYTSLFIYIQNTGTHTYKTHEAYTHTTYYSYTYKTHETYTHKTYYSYIYKTHETLLTRLLFIHIYMSSSHACMQHTHTHARTHAHTHAQTYITHTHTHTPDAKAFARRKESNDCLNARYVYI